MRDQCLIIKLFNWTISVVNPVGCNRPTPNFHGNQHKLMQQHTKQWIYYEHRFSARLFQVSFYPIYFPIPFNLVTKYGTNNQVFLYNFVFMAHISSTSLWIWPDLSLRLFYSRKYFISWPFRTTVATVLLRSVRL